MAISVLAQFAIGFLLLLPTVAVVFSGAHSVDSEIWKHLVGTLLPRYVPTTLALLLSVVGLAALWGAVCSWLIASYEFPGRRNFAWILVLPFTVPSYLAAYAYVDFFQATGPFFGWLNQTMHLTPGFPPTFNVRSFQVAVVIMAAGLCPYVYVACLASLRRQPANLFDVARTLGLNPRQTFQRVALPLMRPALIGGCMLVALEVLNDFGTVDHFAIDTMATGLYRVWYGYGSRDLAAQFAMAFLCFVVALFTTERFLRGNMVFSSPRGIAERPRRIQLDPPRAAAAAAFCALPSIIGFFGPVAILSWNLLSISIEHEFFQTLPFIGRSIGIGASVSSLTLITATLLLLHIDRRGVFRPARYVSAFSSLGYAIPGGLVAVGILMITPPGTEMIYLLLYGLVIRFMALPAQIMESAKERISPFLGMAARTLGAGPMAVLMKVYLPLIAPSALGAALLVFIDTIKELPVAMILRPFNFELLPIRIYNLASDERLASAAVGSLFLIVISIPPVLWFHRGIAQGGLK